MRNQTSSTPDALKTDAVLREDGVVVGNVFDKYNSRNPIARHLMQGFLGSFDRLVKRAACSKVHEVGCGEGHLCQRLARSGLDVRGSDFSEKIISVARQSQAGSHCGTSRAVQYDVASIYDLSAPEDSAELVVCCEVLEHLEEPAKALEVLSRLADPYLLVSVPREPLWRVLNVARGRYLSDLGNTPGHLNHWSQTSFLAFLATAMEIVEIQAPIPWTLVLARSR